MALRLRVCGFFFFSYKLPNAPFARPLICANFALVFTRLRHRHGYGIHSPFAYLFLTDTVGERGRYYACERLEGLCGSSCRFLRRWRLRKSRLLFRLANASEAETMTLVNPSPVDRAHIAAARPRAREKVDETADFVYLNASLDRLPPSVGEGTMLVVDNLRIHRALWLMALADPRATTTFDLGTLGVAFFRRDLQCAHYKA